LIPQELDRQSANAQVVGEFEIVRGDFLRFAPVQSLNLYRKCPASLCGIPAPFDQKWQLDAPMTVYQQLLQRSTVGEAGQTAKSV
jgi:hypothetical protein